MENTIPAPRVRDVMTTILVTLSEEDNLEGVAKAMQSFHFRHVPVVDGTTLVGMVSQADLLRVSTSALLGGAAPSELQHRFEERTFVAEIMTRTPTTIAPDAPLAEAARLLVATKAGALPVVEGDTLVGIVSEIDVLKAAIPFL